MSVTTLHPVWIDAPELRRLFAVLGAPAVDVRCVGGCVRDAVLGRDGPDTEIDVGTPEPPARVMQRLNDAGIKAVPTGLSHGTVTAVVGTRSFEVTSLRRDTACDGRHAAVEFTADWHEDARRRDFTMNAMSMGPDGVVHDDHDGLSDARAGRVRFVGAPADRIQEDYLRILRLFRFVARYGREAIDAETLAACAQHKGGLAQLSAERIQSEMAKLLATADPVPALTQMDSSGVLKQLLPECGTTAFLKSLLAVEQVAVSTSGDWIIRLATLLPTEAVSAVAVRWRMSNSDSARLKSITQLAGLTPQMTDLAFRRALYNAGSSRMVDAILVCWARTPDPLQDAEAWKRLLEKAQNWVPQPLPVGGDDVMALGVSPGPEVGRVLAAMTEWWIAEHFIPSRTQALEQLRQSLKRSP